MSIDLEAVAANYAWLNSQLKRGGRCGAVVKADAYGLGAAEVAPVLYRAGCRDFFVSLQYEGEQLAALLPADVRIVLLTGVRPGCEQRCAEAGLIPVLVTTEQVQSWVAQTSANGVAAPCALKVDSGMTRLGMGATEFSALLQQRELLRTANLQMILSHLACADEPAHPQNRRQLERFQRSVEALRQVCPDVEASLANSSGICLGEEYHFDVVRPGCALYGVNPCPGYQNPMQPVVNLYLPLLQLREVEADCAVGYGATESVASGSWLAVVRGGYADGLLRTQSGRGWGQAVIGSERVTVPMRGRVSMDTTVFDVSALSPTQRAALTGIEILNSVLTVDRMGDAAGTIGYEILTSLGRRYCRRYH
nr:alanine racemase [Microbulbifer celer]